MHEAGRTWRAATLVAAGLFVVVVSAAAAGDPCLGGSARLADQRALRALRDGIDAACRCEAYADAGRGAYRACAKGRLDAALAADTLRPECRRAALADVKGATCGSGRVACGQVRPTSRTPVECRVTSTASCRDGRGTDATVCAAHSRCSEVVDWTAGTCLDPRLPGPYRAGARILTLTKTSAVVAGAPRVVPTVVWYPTAARGWIDPVTSAIRDVPVDLAGGPHPLLIYSHGACGLPTGARFLMPLLASHGFVVAAPAHGGDTWADYPRCLDPTWVVASALERPADAVFVLDSLLAASADPASPLAGAVDPARVGMSGHSFGGYTTFAAVDADPRFRVALLMAPAVPASVPELGVPSLFMLGALDAVGAVGGKDTTNDDRRLAYAAAAPPKLLVEILDAGHFAFSDGCFPGVPTPDCDYPTTLSQDEAHELVRRWVLPFLQRHLRGDRRYEPFLGAGPSGAVVERVY